MSLLLDDSSSQYLEASSAVLTGSTLTMACWAYLDSVLINQTLMALNDASSEDNYHSLDFEGSATNQVRARTRGTGNADALTSSTIASPNVWHHFAGVWTGAASRAAFLDGAGKGTDATSETPSGIDTTAIGRLSKLTPSQYTSGRVAEAAWWNVALTDDEIAQLALGVSPLLIRPEALIAYCPILTDGADYIGGITFTLTNGPTVAEHVTIYEPEPIQVGTFESGAINRSLTSSLTFGQSLVVAVEFDKQLANSIAFGNSVTVVLELTRALESLVAFDGIPDTNVIQIALESVFRLSAIVEPNLELLISLTSQFLIEQKAQRTIEASVSTAFLLAGIASKGADPSNTIKFENNVAGDVSKGQTNNVGFGNSVSPTIERGLPVANDVGFGSHVVAYVERNCDLFEYNPINGVNPLGLDQPGPLTVGIRANITLTCGANVINLRNPEFGNTNSVNPRRVRNITRGKQNKVFREQTWPRTVEQTMSFAALTRIEAQALLTFFKNCLGKEVTFEDQNNLTWVGIIIGPKDPITEVTGDDCSYQAQLTFISTVDVT